MAKVSKDYIKAELERAEQMACEVKTVIKHLADYTSKEEFTHFIRKLRSLELTTIQLEDECEIALFLLQKETKCHEESKV